MISGLDVTLLLQLGLGAFWVVCSGYFFRSIRRGQLAAIARLHQDLAQTASRAAWHYKNAALGAIGVLWIVSAALRTFRLTGARETLAASAAAIALEQLSMPLLTPSHWKSWTGALVGLALAAALLGLSRG